MLVLHHVKQRLIINTILICLWVFGASAVGASESLEARAEAALQQHRFAEAITHYHRLHDQQPDNPTYTLALAQAYQYSNQHAQSVELGLAVLAQDSQHRQALSIVALSALMQGDTAQAQRYYRRWVAAHPDDAQAHLGLSTVLETLGQTDEASAAYRRYQALMGLGN